MPGAGPPWRSCWTGWETLLVTEAEWALLGANAGAASRLGPTRGAHQTRPRGARLLTPVRYLDIPAQFEGRPVDAVGVGDVFAAGYLAGLLIGLSLPQAARLAEAAAGLQVGWRRTTGLPGQGDYGKDHGAIEIRRFLG